jgi:hypothetical protein
MKAPGGIPPTRSWMKQFGFGVSLSGSSQSDGSRRLETFIFGRTT